VTPVFAARLQGAGMLEYPIAAGRKVYLHVARGSLQANGYKLAAGDALMYEDEAEVELSAAKDAEVLLFDMG
jgi:quercetin 2,3-dioxygenase